MIKVNTPYAEFSAAESKGYVYGQIRRKNTFPVYVELGVEQEYRPSPKDDPNTEYRLFTACTIYVAETEEQLDNEQFAAVERNVTVLIYC